MLVATTACGDNGHPGTDGPLSIAVFNRQTDWIHPSNPIALQALVDMAHARGWSVTTSEDPAFFTPELLRDTDVVVFSVTSGNILDDNSRAELGAFIERGGGFVGIHSASHTEWDWPLYLERIVPVTFLTHPTPMNLLSGNLTVEDPADPVVGELPNPWSLTDEFYTFSQRPEDIAGLHIQLALDEDSVQGYPDGDRVGYHPITFSNELAGGRSFYTALGHAPEPIRTLPLPFTTGELLAVARV